VSDLLQTHIIAVLEANHAVAGRTRRLIEELEGQGHRIISGGQLGETGAPTRSSPPATTVSRGTRRPATNSTRTAPGSIVTGSSRTRT